MKLIHTEVRLTRYVDRRTFDGHQELTRVYKVFGITVWVTLIDQEDVPNWTSILRAKTKDPDWQSRLFPAYEQMLSEYRP